MKTAVILESEIAKRFNISNEALEQAIKNKGSEAIIALLNASIEEGEIEVVQALLEAGIEGPNDALQRAEVRAQDMVYEQMRQLARRRPRVREEEKVVQECSKAKGQPLLVVFKHLSLPQQNAFQTQTTSLEQPDASQVEKTTEEETTGSTLKRTRRGFGSAPSVVNYQSDIQGS